ncbi:DUF3304 domain-containing protein [Collimonas antrihumi]|uniref:DUF3304 domain-containing protein n=1 Tax=Collimonas antrihumi TaxID=1940615 RepID=UPI001B8BD000|nr:DUF3304 domain-containing protein [Collimonas antrihumi]
MRIQYLLLFSATLALSACAISPAVTTEAPAKKTSKLVNIPMVPVSIGCFSHPGVGYIYSFYVQEPFSSRMASGLDCGGIVAAGYILPKQWQPGMKVKVRWKPNGRDWIEKTTTIRRYEKAGTLAVHFFGNDEVRIVASPIYAPESSKHPISPDSVTAPPEEE